MARKKKKDKNLTQLYAVFMRHILNSQTQDESEWMRKMYHINCSFMKTGETVLISGKKWTLKSNLLGNIRRTFYNDKIQHNKI